MINSSTVLEVERKFICKKMDEFQKFLLKEPFNMIEKVHEKDDYFVDQNQDFLEKKVCLRIRKSGKKAELTYKGPSILALDPCAKIEYSIVIPNKHVAAMNIVLGCLGYKNYISVEKKRTLYKRKYSDFIYTISIDYVQQLGYFVEFEILASDKKYNKEYILGLLDKWIESYKEFGLEEITLPYRDLVAQKMSIGL